MEESLNKTQLEILKLFSKNQSEDDLVEIKTLMIIFLYDKVIRETDNQVMQKSTPNKLLRSGNRIILENPHR